MFIDCENPQLRTASDDSDWIRTGNTNVYTRGDDSHTIEESSHLGSYISDELMVLILRDGSFAYGLLQEVMDLEYPILPTHTDMGALMSATKVGEFGAYYVGVCGIGYCLVKFFGGLAVLKVPSAISWAGAHFRVGLRRFVYAWLLFQQVPTGQTTLDWSTFWGGLMDKHEGWKSFVWKKHVGLARDACESMRGNEYHNGSYVYLHYVPSSFGWRESAVSLGGTIAERYLFPAIERMDDMYLRTYGFRTSARRVFVSIAAPFVSGIGYFVAFSKVALLIKFLGVCIWLGFAFIAVDPVLSILGLVKSACVRAFLRLKSWWRRR